MWDEICHLPPAICIERREGKSKRFPTVKLICRCDDEGPFLVFPERADVHGWKFHHKRSPTPFTILFSFFSFLLFNLFLISSPCLFSRGPEGSFRAQHWPWYFIFKFVTFVIFINIISSLSWYKSARLGNSGMWFFFELVVRWVAVVQYDIFILKGESDSWDFGVGISFLLWKFLPFLKYFSLNRSGFLFECHGGKVENELQNVFLCHRRFFLLLQHERIV